MKAIVFLMHGAACAALLAAAGCDRGYRDSTAGVRQTKFPGQVTAGGRTSGQVIAASAKPTTDATYAGGHPGMAGGAGGTTGGAATAGTVSETGKGPSQGTAPTSGAGGNLATQPQPSEYAPAPAPAPAPGKTEGGAAAHRDNAASQAAPGQMEKK